MAELESDLGDLQVEGNVLNQLRVKNLRSTRGSEEGRGRRCNLVWGRAVPVVPRAARRIPESLVKLLLGHGLCRVHGRPLAKLGPGGGAGSLCRSMSW